MVWYGKIYHPLPHFIYRGKRHATTVPYVVQLSGLAAVFILSNTSSIKYCLTKTNDTTPERPSNSLFYGSASYTAAVPDTGLSSLHTDCLDYTTRHARPSLHEIKNLRRYADCDKIKLSRGLHTRVRMPALKQTLACKRTTGL